MKFRSLLTAVSLAAVPLAGQSETKLRTVTLEDCIQEAFENNLDIKIVRYLPELAELTLAGNYGAYDPNYSFIFGANKRTSPGAINLEQGTSSFPSVSWNESYDMGLNGLLPTGTTYRLFGGLDGLRQKGFDFQSQDYRFAPPLYPGAAGVEMTQPLLRNFWIDQPRWAISLNKKTIIQEQQGVRSILIDIATQVQTTYYTMAAARESIAVQTKAVELAERLLMENRKRVEVGAMAPLESQQAEAQLATTRADLISAQAAFGQAQNTLRRLLTTDYSDHADTILEPGEKFSPQPYPFNRQESWTRGLTMRPDIIQSQLELEKQNVTIRFRRNQMFPQLDLIGTFGITANATDLGLTLNEMSNTEFKNYGVGARLNIPLGNRTARSALKGAKLEKERIILRHKQLEQSVMLAIDNSILVAKTAYERIQATKEARVFAEAALDAEQKKLENGKSTTFEVLRLQRDLTSARSQEVNALLDYFSAMASLFQDEGSTLERLGVRVTTD